MADSGMALLRRRVRVFGAGFLLVLLAGCGQGRDLDSFASLRANPMASPTLSFAVPTSFSGSAGGNVGLEVQSRVSTVFGIDESETEQAIGELLAQAEAAGFEMEMVDTFGDPGRFYSSKGQSPELLVGVGLTDEGARADVVLRQ